MSRTSQVAWQFAQPLKRVWPGIPNAVLVCAGSRFCFCVLNAEAASDPFLGVEEGQVHGVDGTATPPRNLPAREAEELPWDHVLFVRDEPGQKLPDKNVLLDLLLAAVGCRGAGQRAATGLRGQRALKHLAGALPQHRIRDASDRDPRITVDLLDRAAVALAMNDPSAGFFENLPQNDLILD